jgi:hypothetical protein
MEAEDVTLFYKTGIDPLSGLLRILEQAERIESVGRGSYKVKEPWANGANTVFQASKASNMVDANVLYECPALVDAKDEQEVRDYLSIFQEAIDATLSDDNKATEAKDEFFDGENEEE